MITESVGIREDQEDHMRVIRVALFHLFVLASAILIAPASPFAQIGVSVTVAPACRFISSCHTRSRSPHPGDLG